MNATESKTLTKGTRVYWQGNAADGGTIIETTWDSVTITWDNGHLAIVHHSDMREVMRKPQAKGNRFSDPA
jgi:hypothetical protein